MNKVKILQLGNENLANMYQIADCAEWIYEPDLWELPKRTLDMVIIGRAISEEEAQILSTLSKAYCLFVTEQTEYVPGSPLAELFLAKQGKIIPPEDLSRFLLEEPPYYFSSSYGEKLRPWVMSVAQNFKGQVVWDGFQGIDLSGDFGEEMSQIFYWRHNLPIGQGQCLEFWLEYEKEDTVELQFQAYLNISGTVGTDMQVWNFTEAQLKDMMYIENTFPEGRLFLSLQARGHGKLHITTLHDRFSRRGRGDFLTGGERIVTKEREEAFFYFDPADRKPPLNVYFAGYKTQEGFEGYYMMRKMGCPFLLISDSRLEGGAFYMGSPEYEKMIADKIRSYMDQLGFTSDQVIFSGLSMGTYGALFYGCDIIPKAIVIGKPLASLGDIADNERVKRPGGFSTSLDVLKKYTGGMSKENETSLNRRFWKKFSDTNWKNTIFAVAYMIEDDYDTTAYQRLITYLDGEGVLIFGKGLHGRHNDDTNGIVGWFAVQYRRIINENFGRELE